MPNQFNRRALVSGAFALGATAMLSASGAAKSRKTFFDRVGLPIGLQMYTLGEDPGKDLDGTMAKIAAIGFRDVQLPSLFGKTARDVRAAADRAGLKITSVHLAAPSFAPPGAFTLGSPVGEITDALGILGAKSAVLPIMLLPQGWRTQTGESVQSAIARVLATAGADIYKQTAALLNERAAGLKPSGIELGYHNHNCEFLPVAGTTGWDILMKETDASLVKVEVDIGWVSAAGRDPVTFIKRHAGRLTNMHVKDVKPSTVTNFALKMDPTEVGSGRIDWAKVLPAAHKAGVRRFFVEQEPPFSMPRIDSAAKSFSYLSKLVA